MNGVSPLQDALPDSSLRDVVAAAKSSQCVLVEHSLEPSLAEGGLLDPASVSVPEGWVRKVDGAVEPVSTTRPRELGAEMPDDSDGPTVLRLYHLQHSPGLSDITDSVFNPLQRVWPSDEPWIETDAGLFVASDGAVTPAHADRHHNLLVQVSGTKTVAVCAPGSKAHADRLARSMPSLYADEMPPGTEHITLAAGYALYMPPYTLHWVRSEGQSVAVSFGWKSDATVRAGQVYAANATLRRLKVPPRAVGHRSDGVKLRAAAAARGVRQLARRD